jgi:hypothetical protein
MTRCVDKLRTVCGCLGVSSGHAVLSAEDSFNENEVPEELVEVFTGGSPRHADCVFTLPHLRIVIGVAYFPRSLVSGNALGGMCCSHYSPYVAVESDLAAIVLTVRLA